MQRLSREYRASLIHAAANADSSLDPGDASESRDYGRGRHVGYRDDHRDVGNSGGDRGEVDRYLSQEDDDDQPTYWYWSYDLPDAGI
ncbi:MAG: hypothetical protein WA747_12840 [Steroidobacteraceae bacterium]